MKHPEVSLSGLTKTEVDVPERDSAVEREHVCALPALRRVELAAVGTVGRGS